MSAIQISSFFEPQSHTFSYLVSCPATKECAVIDSVLNFNLNTGEVSTGSLDEIIATINSQGLQLKYILETHIHADHLSGAYSLQQKLGGQLAISQGILEVQARINRLFNLNPSANQQGAPFNLLLADEQLLPLGASQIKVLLTPGHTPCSASFLIEGNLFVGDTLFMPDYGTARCDFPGANPHQLYASIYKLLSLPEATRMYMCHDYLPQGRNHFSHLTSVGEQLKENIFLQGVKSAEDFAQLRQKQDAQLGLPKLIYPALQVNINAGKLPPAEANGQAYLKLPLTGFC